MPLQSLANTYYKLTNNKSLKVGYIGGSVTVGYGASNPNTKSWRALTTAWLRSRYPSATILERNAAINGTGSLFGACRIKDDLLAPFNPDLIFVEFAINDAYQQYTQAESERYMESLVRTVYEFNRNTDIVLVYTTDTGKKGGDFSATYAFDKVAKHYGLLTINLGKYMKNDVGVAEMTSGGAYFVDYAHPSDAGYAKYASYIQTFLMDNLTGGTSIQAHPVPEPLRTDLLKNPRLITAADIHNANPGVGSTGGTNYNLPKGKSITVSFTGKTVMMRWKTPLGENITMALDGGGASMIPHKNADGTQRILYDNLTAGTHTLTLTNNSENAFSIQSLYVTD